MFEHAHGNLLGELGRHEESRAVLEAALREMDAGRRSTERTSSDQLERLLDLLPPVD